MNNSAKFQLYPPNSFWRIDFLIFFRKFNLSVAKATNQLRGFDLNGMLGGGPLNRHFVKIAAMR